MVRRSSRRVPAFAVLALAVSLVAVEATGAAVSAGQRPTVGVVKGALVKHWDVDSETSVDKITLKFRKLSLLATRPAVPYRDYIEPGKQVTPVTAVFDQRTVRTGREPITNKPIVSCSVYRWNFTGLFWRGDFGWEFKKRDVTFKRISSSC